jgi:MarR family transcriptional regulator, temperature-dependent positive regulator of motility
MSTVPTAAGSMVLLTRLTRAIYRRSTEDVLGMRMKHYATLARLRDYGDMSQQALCTTLMLDRNNCVLLLNELEEAGYVERVRDRADRRRHVVELTPAGRKALDRAEVKMETIEDEVLGALSPDERVTLRTLLIRALEGDAG